MLAREVRAVRDIELALHVSVIGDRGAAFMAPPDTDTAAARQADSVAVLPLDPAAAVEELQRRREEIGFSCVVIGAAFVDTFAPVVRTGDDHPWSAHGSSGASTTSKTARDQVPSITRPSGVGVPGAWRWKSRMRESFTPNTASQSKNASPRTKMCVTRVR